VVQSRAALARGAIRPEQRHTILVVHRQQLAVERIDNGGIDRRERDLTEPPVVLEAMTADESEARFMQRAHFAAELLVGERSAVLGEQPVESALARTLRRELCETPRAPGIEHGQEHTLDALYGGIIIGAQCLAADRARATVITLARPECPARRREIITPAPANKRLAARIVGQRQHRASPPLASHTSSPMFSFPGRASEAISWRLATWTLRASSAQVGSRRPLRRRPPVGRGASPRNTPA
jgi:hypothetical protein